MGDEAMATALESSLKKGDVAVCIKKSKKKNSYAKRELPNRLWG
jgi:hypothetical protein